MACIGVMSMTAQANATGYGDPAAGWRVWTETETRREAYDYVRRWGKLIRDAKSVVRMMVVEQPSTEPGKAGADSV
jgi:hypothetical protein